MAQPFDTVLEGLGPVNPGGTLHITTNDSKEVLTINQAVTLQAVGGPVRLGVTSSILGAGAPLRWLKITEIMYNPSAGGAEYLELQNTGPAALDVTGVNFVLGIFYTFPATTVLSPGERIVLVRSTDAAVFNSQYPGIVIGGTYTGALNNGGETLQANSPGAVPFLTVTYNDAGGWPGAADGLGFSLVIINLQGDPNDPNNWRGSTDDGGSPGTVQPDPNNPTVVVNEALTHTDLPFVDSIEIYNTTGATADIRGWFISDNKKIPQKARFPDSPQFNILPGDYATIDESTFAPGANPGSVGGNPLPGFFLSSLGEDVFIFSADLATGVMTGYAHGFSFGPAENTPGFDPVSFGREVTTDGREHFVAQTALSFGSVNPGPAIGDLAISEIHYNPVPGGVEYVKVTNRTGSAVDLFDNVFDANNTHRISGIGFEFPTGQSIPASGSVLIVNAPPAQYIARFGNPGIPVYGPFGNHDGADNFGLSNNNEKVRIKWADEFTIDPGTGLPVVPYISMDETRYDDDLPWPNADNNLMSITRNNLGVFGSEPTNWTGVSTTHQPSSGAALPVNFSLNPGFYNTGQSLTMTTATPGGADIWYTTDGSVPAPSFGTSTQYTSAVSITSNAAVRAAAFKTGFLPSTEVAGTYIIGAPANEKALNALAIIGDSGEDLFAPNGVMAINGGTYVKSTFNTAEWKPNLPNVAGGLADFDDVTPGIQSTTDALGNPVYVSGGPADSTAYNNAVLHGRFVEREVSFEMLDPLGVAPPLQTNAGVRVHGSTFHRPRYAMDPAGDWTTPLQVAGIPDIILASYLKFSLRMYFRGDYGLTKLNWGIFPGDPLTPNYDKVALRGGHNDGYNPFIKDELTRRLYIDMGNVSARGEVYSLYINGVYRGYYNATERHDTDFLASRYSASKDWDLLTHPADVAGDPFNLQVSSGDKVAWDDLMDASALDLTIPANYNAVAGMLDIDAFIDYLLIQMYSGNDDWPNNNYGVARERIPGGTFRFLVWDAEATYLSGNNAKTGMNFFPFWMWAPVGGAGLKGENVPIAALYRALTVNTTFKSAFAARAHLHFDGGGALDVPQVTARYNVLKSTMLSVLPGGVVYNDHIGITWIAAREAVVLADLTAEGLYP